MNRKYLSGITVAMALVAGGHALAEGPETQEMLAMIKDYRIHHPKLFS